MSEQRDTHFAGFAKLLHDELQAIMREGLDQNWNSVDVDRRQRERIAQRFYDFAYHVMDSTGAGFYASHYLRDGEAMADIEDLSAWPQARE